MKKLAMCMCVLAMSMTTTLAAAQTSCQLEMDEAGKTQWEYCSTWLPCQIALKAIKVCGDAQKVLGKLKQKITGPFGSDKPEPLDADMVFDAAAPEPKGAFKDYWAEKRKENAGRLSGSTDIRETKYGIVVTSPTSSNGIAYTGFNLKGVIYRGTLNRPGSSMETININKPDFDSIGSVRNNKFEAVLQIEVGSQRFNGLNGISKVVYSGGVIYEGPMENGEPNGNGKFSLPDGRSLAGTYVMGKAYGEMTFADKLGNTEQRTYDNGKMIASNKPAPAIEASDATGSNGFDNALSVGLGVLGAVLQAQQRQGLSSSNGRAGVQPSMPEGTARPAGCDAESFTPAGAARARARGCGR